MRTSLPVASLLILAATSCAHRGAINQDRLSYQLAEIMVAHHAYEQAVPLLQRAIAEDPNNPRTHLMFGIVLRDRGLLEEAESAMLRAEALQPGQIETTIALAILYDAWQKPEQAQPLHRKAVKLSPASSEVYNNLGFSLSLQKRYDAAIVCFKEGLKRDPSAHRIYNNMGFAQARKGDYEAAYKSFVQAGGRAAALHNLGLAYELQGDSKSAKAMYREALLADPKLKSARRGLNGLTDLAVPLEPGDAPKTEAKP